MKTCLGFCKAAKLAEIRKHGHVLTPGRYVGAEAAEDGPAAMVFTDGRQIGATLDRNGLRRIVEIVVGDEEDVRVRLHQRRPLLETAHQGERLEVLAQREDQFTSALEGGLTVGRGLHHLAEGESETDDLIEGLLDGPGVGLRPGHDRPIVPRAVIRAPGLLQVEKEEV